MNSKILSIILAFLFISFSASAASQLSIENLKGEDVLSKKMTSPELNQKKGLVVVFLSAVCPCSNSHIKELNDLAKTYSDYQFIGVHSNVDEDAEKTKNYFQSAALPFAVIQDEKAKIADEYGAYKTPHAYVLDPKGQILYQGGVSSSHVIERAEHKFLREALEDLKQNRSIKTPEGRTLGCAISRGEQNVWKK